MRQTRLTRQAEARAGKPLTEALPELLNIRGIKGTAEFLGVPKGSIDYWCRELRMERRFVVVPPGYRLVLMPMDPLVRQIDLLDATT